MKSRKILSTSRRSGKVEAQRKRAARALQIAEGLGDDDIRARFEVACGEGDTATAELCRRALDLNLPGAALKARISLATLIAEEEEAEGRS